MALNRTIYFPNPSKSLTYGLNDVIRRDEYEYSTIFTVPGTATLKLSNGFFAIDYALATSAQQIEVNIGIGTKLINVFKAYVPATGSGTSRFTLQDLGINDIFLTTGDQITIQFTYNDSANVPTGNIMATLYFEDYTA
jgi:hypothetical protein